MRTLPLSLALLLGSSLSLGAQNFPMEIHRSADGRTITTGDGANTGLYDQAQIRSIYLTFSQPNYWQTLLANNAAEIDIPATMVLDGVTYDSVGVRFRGNTSFNGTRNSEKKSFNISVDFVHDDQRVMGYKTLNLLNCYEDPSFIREVYYQHQIKRHVPAAKSAFTRLYINGAYWGLYPNVQQLNKDYYKEWFLSNDGTNWRADAPSGTTGGGPGGGPQWGDGTAALNYLGADTTLYQKYYTLKSSDQEHPWSALVATCNALNSTPIASLASVIPNYLDVDRTLWFLASEILYSDDDSYVNKGKMDYYLYWEAETGRITPQEYDGNSVMDAQNQNWGPFYHETNANYPLLNRLLAVPEYRQRYLAHLRTLVAEQFDQESAIAVINQYVGMIDTIVQNDPKKLYDYSEFQSHITILKNFIATRRNLMLNNTEVKQVAPTIGTVSYSSPGGTWVAPTPSTEAHVSASVAGTEGVSGVNLYYSDQLVGNFTKVAMADDGAHNDGAAGDGVYGGTIPGDTAGTLVRFYIEAASNNSAKSVSYSPVGAEHDVYTYTVQNSTAAAVDTAIVINELMASNSKTTTDEAGEYEDWIELYNKSDRSVDLSGYHLTDDPSNLSGWTFPTGSIIPAHGYYIVWTDNEGSEGDAHASLKLSASGEQLILLDSALNVIDSTSWGAQTADMGYARLPNGYGSFIIQEPTFNASNDATTPTIEKNVAINEIMALNLETATDEAGDRDPWIELYNKTSNPVDLSGYSLTNDAAAAGWTFPQGSMIPANGYLIVWADNEPSEGNTHASALLPAAGGHLFLLHPTLAVIDSANWDAQTTDRGYARVPNGVGSFVVQQPTFSASNNLDTPVGEKTVVINELMASNSKTVTDEAEDYEDWIELYNTSNAGIDLSGYHLTDDPSNLTGWTFPQGSFIPAGGYLIIWAGNEANEGSMHASFKLSASGEQILLLNPSLAIIDSTSWGEQAADMSYARIPNGTGNFSTQPPTFNGNNEVIAGVERADAAMRIVPNPAHGQVRIDLARPEQLVVMNALGVEVYNRSVENSVVLDITNWPAGLYIVRTSSTTARMIVQP